MRAWLGSRIDGPEDIDGGGPKAIELVRTIISEAVPNGGWVFQVDPPVFTKRGPANHVLLVPRHPSQSSLTDWIEAETRAQAIEAPDTDDRWAHTYRVWVALPRVRNRPGVWMADHFDQIDLRDGEVVVSKGHLSPLRVEIFDEGVTLLEKALAEDEPLESIERLAGYRPLAVRVHNWRQEYKLGRLAPEFIERLEGIPEWRWDPESSDD